jgi:hypothetical protein
MDDDDDDDDDDDIDEDGVDGPPVLLQSRPNGKIKAIKSVCTRVCARMWARD